jgi:hypothetical protein
MVGGMNQLDRLQAMDLFDAPLATPYKTALPTPYGNPTPPGSAEQRARSYLQGHHALQRPAHRG